MKRTTRLSTYASESVGLADSVFLRGVAVADVGVVELLSSLVGASDPAAADVDVDALAEGASSTAICEDEGPSLGRIV